jgi:hypothetical protein
MSVILTDKIQPRTTGIALTVVGDMDVTGAVSVAGTITYEDVTNVDSVGLITARSGLRVTAGGVVVTAGVSTFTDDVKVNSTLTATEGIHVSAGVGTFASSSSGDYVRVYGGSGTGKWDIYGNGADLRFTDNDSAGVVRFDTDLSIADKIIHTGDTDTTIRFPAADTITAETGGSERLRIDSNGKLLVGGTSTDSSALINIIKDTTEVLADNEPLYNNASPAFLTVYNSNNTGSGEEAGINIVPAGSANGAISIYGKKTGSYAGDLIFRFRSGASTSAERLRVTSGGQLELRKDQDGVTGRPDNRIVFKDTDSSVVAEQPIGEIAWHSTDSGMTNINSYIRGINEATNGSGALTLGVKAAGSSEIEALRITSTGAVGIGTAIPNGDLDIVDDDSSARIYLRSGNSDDASIYFGRMNDSATAAIRNDHSDNSFRFYGYNNSERMRINSDGQAIFKGDGTASQGSIGIEAGEPFIRLYDTNGTSNYRKWDIRNVGAGSYLQFRTINDANDTFATKMAIDVNGDVCIGGHTSASARLDVRTAVDGGTNLLMLQNDDASNYGQLTIELGKTDREVRFAGGYNNNFMTFYTQASGSSNERVRITDTGELLVNTTSSDSYKFKVSSAQKAAFLNHSGTGDDIAVKIRHARGGLSGYAGKAVSFCGNDDSEEGSIVIGTTSTAFNTSSDYRLKENQVVISDGITRLKQLKPYRFNFKKDPSVTVDGFFAHEVTPVVPQAVSGEKDAMSPETRYEEGDSIPSGKFVGDPKTYSTTEIDAQSVDYSKVVPLLTAALQEAIAKIETLETKVATLES